MHTFLQDLKFSLRLLGKTPAFTGAAVAVLALGIGLNTAMFSVIHLMIFQQPAYAEPERVVQLYTQDTKQPDNYRAFSHPTYLQLRERPDLFAGVLAHTIAMVGVGHGTEARRTFAAVVSDNYFDVLGVKLQRGRAFSAEETRLGADLPVVIASHGYWRRTGFDPALIGSMLRVNERLYTVIGIAPEGFTGTMSLIGPELFFPLGAYDALANDFAQGEARRTLARDDAYNLFVVARLKDGVSLESANPALTGVSHSLEQQFPVGHKDKHVTAAPLPRFGTSTSPSSDSGLRVFGLLLLGMTGAVLLVVCLNLAGLLLARGHARRKEFAIRLALGGGRGRIVRQLLTEGLLLSLVGGALGLMLASWSTHLFVTSVNAVLPIAVAIPDIAGTQAVIATLAFAVFATACFAFGPALKLSRRDVLTDLKLQAGEDAPERRRAWLPRHPLVVAQISLSLALLIAAGLFIRLAFRIVGTDFGYHADNTILAEMDAGMGGHDELRAREIYRTVGARLSSLPGVKAASIGSTVPYGFVHLDREVQRAGARPTPGAKPASAAEGRAFRASWNSVGTDYFAAMGLPLLRGRLFTASETDHQEGPAVAIIDDVLARKLWPDGDALGQRIQFAERDAKEDGAAPSASAAPITYEVVGIVAGVKTDVFDPEPAGAAYLPFGQGFASNVYFHVRPAVDTSAAAHALTDTVRRELRAAAPDVPVFKVRTFAEHRDASIEFWAVRGAAALFTLFGGLALVVAVVGIYGLKAYAVSRRTREIGIRLALGAEPERVRNLILREGLSLTLTGIALGLLAGLGVGRLLGSVFVDFNGYDPVAFAVAAVALFAAAMVACWLPARKATKVNPLTALRTE